MSRSPSPAPSLASDVGADSCDEVDEGIFRGEDDSSDVEIELENDIEDQIIEEIEEKIKEEQQLEKGKKKEIERMEEDDLIIVEPQAKAVAIPGYVRIDQFSNLLRKRPQANGIARSELKIAKKQANSALRCLRSSYRRVCSTLSAAAEALRKKADRPLKLSEFPLPPLTSNLGRLPFFPTVQYRAPLPDLPANGLRNLVAAGGDGGGGGEGGEIELDASTQDTGSTRTCPGGEDAQVEENAGMAILGVQKLVEGETSTDHFYSPFPPEVSHSPQTLSTYDLTTKTLSTRCGLLSSSTVELFKGHTSSYRYQLSNFSLFLLQPDFVKVLRSRLPFGQRFYNILDSRQATRRFGPGHFSTNRSHYRLFSRNGQAVVAVEVRWKEKTNGEISFYHYVYIDSSMVDVGSLKEELEKQGFVEAKKRRGVRVPAAITNKIEKWIENLPDQVQVHVRRLEEHSPSQNPLVTSPPSAPIVNTGSIKSSTSFSPSTQLRSNISLSSAKMPSKDAIYHDFQRRLINEFSTGFELNTMIRGGAVLKNTLGEEVQIETAFGITESLGEMGKLLESSTGGLVLAKEVGTVHVALPRGAASKFRSIHHKTLPYQAVLIVQNFYRDKPEYHGNHVFMGIISWTSNQFMEVSLSSILIVHSDFDKPAIIGGEYWLARRAGCSHDPHREMGLLSLSKTSRRYSKKKKVTLDQESAGSLRGLVKVWQALLDGSHIEVALHKSVDDVFSFHLPFSTNLAVQRDLPLRSLRICFSKSKKLKLDGTLPLGAKLDEQKPQPSKIRLYSDKMMNLSCSFDKSTQRHLLDDSNLTQGTSILLNYAKWIMLDEMDEGRMPGLETEIPSQKIKEMVQQAKSEYEALKNIGTTKEAVNKMIFESPFPYKNGYAVWLHNGCFVNFEGLDSSVPLPYIKGLNSTPRYKDLGHPGKKKNDDVPETLYYCYRRDHPTKKQGEVWVKGETATGKIDIIGTWLWSAADEKKVLKAVNRCAELHEEMCRKGAKRMKVG
ncbi:hypothetical protein JCM3765_006557 [Sporobolomyces pararoseus]